MTNGSAPLRRLVTCLDGRRVPLNAEARATMQGDIPYWGAGSIVDYVDRHLFEETLVLVGEDGAPFFDHARDVAFLIEGPVWVNNHIHVLRTNSGVDPRFLRYALNVVDYAEHINGSTRDKLTQDQMLSIQIPLPPLEVQQRIADFLDDQVARIDRAIQLRQRQAELMTHRHLTAVSEAVDQLGEFHGWVPLRRFVVGIEQGWSPQCDALPASDSEWGVVKVGAVRSGRFRAGENKRLPEELSPEVLYEIHAGDLLITRANTPELVGDVCVVPRGVRSRLILCDKIMRVRVDARVSPEFVAIAAQSRRSRMHFSALASGASQSMVNIRGEDVREMAIPLTPEVGQQALIRSTTESREFLDTLRQGIQASMALLSERRRSLITAAVTGEFDVSSASSRAADVAITGEVV